MLRGSGIVVQSASLAVGDYLLGEQTVVERKTVRHLHAAVAAGVFWAQIGRLRANYRLPFLLIEGQDLYCGPLDDEAVRGLCLAVIDCGVRLLRTEDTADSARWLVLLAARRQRSQWTPDRPPYAQRPKMLNHGDAAEAVLAATPGLSSVTARALLERFGTVAGVLAAGPRAWTAVPGIGTERAKRLAETMGVELARDSDASSSQRSCEKPGPST